MARNIGRMVFAYVLVLLPVVVLIAGFGMMAGLPGRETLLWAFAGCLLVGAAIFTFFEVRRIASAKNGVERACEEEDVEQYTEHVLVVAPGTGEPYPHHETQAGSAGFDQGQLTSRIPDSTPLLGDLLEKIGRKTRQPNCGK